MQWDYRGIPLTVRIHICYCCYGQAEFVNMKISLPKLITNKAWRSPTDIEWNIDFVDSSLKFKIQMSFNVSRAISSEPVHKAPLQLQEVNLFHLFLFILHGGRDQLSHPFLYKGGGVRVNAYTYT